MQIGHMDEPTEEPTLTPCMLDQLRTLASLSTILTNTSSLEIISSQKLVTMLFGATEATPAAYCIDVDRAPSPKAGSRDLAIASPAARSAVGVHRVTLIRLSPS